MKNPFSVDLATVLLLLASLTSSCTLSFALVGAGIDATKAKNDQTLFPGEISTLERGNLIVVYTYDQLALTGRFQEANLLALDSESAGINITRNDHLVHIPWYTIEKIGVIKENRNALLIGALTGAALDAILIYDALRDAPLKLE